MKQSPLKTFFGLIISLLTFVSLNTFANEAALVHPSVVNVTLCSSIQAVCEQLPIVIANPKVIASASWAPATSANYLYFDRVIDNVYNVYFAKTPGHIFATTNDRQQYYGHPSKVSTIAFGNFSKKPVKVDIFIQQAINSHPEFYASLEVPVQTREFLYLKQVIFPYRIFFKTSHEMTQTDFQVLYK